MDPVIASLAAAGVLVLTGYLVTRRMREADNHRREEFWREAARVAGLTAIEQTSHALEGWVGSLRVRLSRYEGENVSGTRVTVSGPGLPADLTARLPGLGTQIRGAVGQTDVEIGEEAFDRAVWVHGPPALARAILDAETRRGLRALLAGRLERAGRSPFWATGCLEHGELRVDIADLASWRGIPYRLNVHGGSGEDELLSNGPIGYAYLRGPEKLPEALALALALARRLTPPEDVADRLADNLTRGPEPRARLLALTTLLEEFPEHAATRRALLAARSDPDARVRLAAGVRLGDEGRRLLLDLAGGEGAGDHTNAQAVAALQGKASALEVAPILTSALRTRRTETARACLELLGRTPGAGVIAALAKVLAVERGELAMVAAEALGATGDATAEPPLLEALSGAHDEVRVAAARALGRVGTAAAVPALNEAQAGGGRLRNAARQAIAEIHSRLRGASPGQLSLASGESGALSLAEPDPTGRLSLTDRRSSVDGR